MTHLYDVLDVEPSATADEIRTAWRSAVADLDPTDRRFRVYNQAAEVLLDRVRRSAYDAERRARARTIRRGASRGGTTGARPMPSSLARPPTLAAAYPAGCSSPWPP